MANNIATKPTATSGDKCMTCADGHRRFVELLEREATERHRQAWGADPMGFLFRPDASHETSTWKEFLLERTWLRRPRKARELARAIALLMREAPRSAREIILRDQASLATIESTPSTADNEKIVSAILGVWCWSPVSPFLRQDGPWMPGFGDSDEHVEVDYPPDRDLGILAVLAGWFSARWECDARISGMLHVTDELSLNHTNVKSALRRATESVRQNRGRFGARTEFLEPLDAAEALREGRLDERRDGPFLPFDWYLPIQAAREALGVE